MRKTNYHTHTKRCNHAQGSDEEYVLSAIYNGYEELGFSDHSPWKYDSNFVPKMRMKDNEFDEYYQSILALKEKYKDQISIKIGLECEYFPKYMDWLKELIKKYQLDYVIFGNHYYKTDENQIYFGRRCKDDEMFKLYVDEAIEGMKTGLYSYLAHPDLFMRAKDEFDDIAKEESYRLCKAAKELDVILEYNLAGAEYNERVGKCMYPHPEFWKIAASVGNKVIIGVDAHSPDALKTDKYRNEGIRFLTELGIEIVDTIPFLNYKDEK